MTMDQIRKAAGEITSSLPEKIYTRKDVKNVILELLIKLEECDNTTKSAETIFKDAVVEGIVKHLKAKDDEILYGRFNYEKAWKKLRSMLSDAMVRSARANGKLHKYSSYLEISMIMDEMEKPVEPVGLVKSSKLDGLNSISFIMDDLIPESVKKKLEEVEK